MMRRLRRGVRAILRDASAGLLDLLRAKVEANQGQDCPDDEAGERSALDLGIFMVRRGVAPDVVSRVLRDVRVHASGWDAPVIGVSLTLPCWRRTADGALFHGQVEALSHVACVTPEGVLVSVAALMWAYDSPGSIECQDDPRLSPEVVRALENVLQVLQDEIQAGNPPPPEE